MKPTTAPAAISPLCKSPANESAQRRRSAYVSVACASGARRKGAEEKRRAFSSTTSRNVRIPRLLQAVAASIVAEQLVVGRLAHLLGRQRMDHACDVEEMPVVEIVGNAVPAPASATHRERERQRIVEAAAGRKTMRLIDDHATNGKRLPERERAYGVARMQTDRMAGALIVENACSQLRGRREVGDAIKRQDRR